VQLQLHYQPKVQMSDGSVVGFEALLRWRRGNEFVPPGIFIPIAERTGLITELGRWALEKAIAQIAQWRSLGAGNIPVAVNISTQQLVSSNLVEIIREACLRNMVDARYLQAEVTESLLIDDADSAMKLLQDIRQLGCSIALDDFGTGFSSLSYLRQLPLDVLKIDRSFTTTIEASASRPSLVTSIIGIARSLNLKTVAEGVASPLHWRMLEHWGCDEAQGYLMSPAVPPAQVPDLWKYGSWDRKSEKFTVLAPGSQQQLG
jgi:EAL domain-containing protein (putative c-di-GMP-specific phosphodiesterase class I)